MQAYNKFSVALASVIAAWLASKGVPADLLSPQAVQGLGGIIGAALVYLVPNRA